MPATQLQIPEHSILDNFSKQTYSARQFVASLVATVGTSETAALLITMPANTNVSHFAANTKIALGTLASTAVMRIYLNPTVSSNGTPVTPVNMRQDAAHQFSAQSLIYSSPSVSANGTLLDSSNSATSMVKIIGDAKATLLITLQASAASSSVNLHHLFYEL